MTDVEREVALAVEAFAVVEVVKLLGAVEALAVAEVASSYSAPSRRSVSPWPSVAAQAG
jgi:hypothetical protein